MADSGGREFPCDLVGLGQLLVSTYSCFREWS